MIQKTVNKNSKQIMVVYFGSEDLFNMPSDRQYKEMLNRLGEFLPPDIASLPILIAGNISVRLKTERVSLAEDEVLKFKIGKSRRAPAKLEDDNYVKRAMTQLDMALTQTRPRFVLVPYYVTLVKKKKNV